MSDDAEVSASRSASPEGTSIVTHSQSLRLKLELVGHVLSAPTRSLLDHPHAYRAFLSRVCCIAQSFVPLLEEATERAREMALEDPVANGLVPYLEKHIVEESGEDMMADLEALGLMPSEVLSHMSSPSIAALVGSQYYWVHHCHPLVVLGYIEVLEGYPCSRGIIEELIVNTGLPRAGFRSLLQHAELDIGHRDELHCVLDALPLDDRQTSLLGVSAIETVHLLNETLKEVFDEAAEG
ncbi:MAG: hypothetical protein H0T12_04675 [Actinobacteria bacterium]|nr:hypothetical protein [Actinomycetota bacterium]